MTDFKVFVLHVLQSSDEHFSLINQMQVGELSVLDHVLAHTLGSVFLSFCVKTEDPKLDLVLRTHGIGTSRVLNLEHGRRLHLCCTALSLVMRSRSRVAVGLHLFAARQLQRTSFCRR